MQFEVLGPLRVHGAERTLSPAGPLQSALLGVLLHQPNREVPVDTLVHALWGERAEATPPDRLHVHVHRLRRGLGESDRISSGPGGYRLRVLPGELDVERFETLAERAEDRSGDPERRAELGRQALALWRGTAYQNVDVPQLCTESQRLEERRLTLEEEVLRAELVCGREQAAIPELAALHRRFPLREGVAGLLMTALFRSGRHADALQVYEGVRGAARDELGLDPGPALRDLHQRILRGDAELASPPRAAAVRTPRQLPMVNAEFVGRREELRMLRHQAEQAQDGRCQVTVIEGMAGVGKTSLALSAAHLINQRGLFGDIQLWGELHGATAGNKRARTSALLADFLRHLGVPACDIPASLSARSALYRDRLAGRRVLVILDGAACEEQVVPLLPGAASRTLALVTARRSLTGLDGSNAIRLRELSRQDALELFSTAVGTERTRSEPEATERVLERCGHHPAMLALAARNLRSHPRWRVETLAERLAQQPCPLRNLRGGHSIEHAFGASYRALTPAARRHLRLLALETTEEFSLETASALGGMDAGRAGQLLDQLLDGNLIQDAAPDRFRIPVVVRGHVLRRALGEEPATERAAGSDQLLSASGAEP